MRINKDREIGYVIYIVEGSSTEFNLLKRIFCSVLGFEYIEKRRNSERFFEVKKDNGFFRSKIAVINTSNSNITDISDEEYLDELFELLINEFHFPVDKATIYYLFDRDPGSNKAEDVRRYVEMLRNPIDNADGMKAGLLLLSYPCIESYLVSCFVKDTYRLEFGIGNRLKPYIGQNSIIQMNKITEETLLLAADEFLSFLNSLKLFFDLDNFADTSLIVFDKQEEKFDREQVFNLFSMLSLSFIQMGIIELD